MPSTGEIRVTHHYDSSRETVFDAWITPESARRFLFATDDGEIVRCDTLTSDNIPVDQAERAKHGWNTILNALARVVDQTAG